MKKIEFLLFLIIALMVLVFLRSYGVDDGIVLDVEKIR